VEYELLGPLRVLDGDGAEVPLSAPNVRSVLAVPVVSQLGHVEGALVLVDDRPGVFDARDEELAIVAAKHSATAREYCRLYQEAK